jgi:hypothetical protein
MPRHAVAIDFPDLARRPMSAYDARIIRAAERLVPDGYLHPRAFSPLHEVNLPRLRDAIAQDLHQHGWRGRPLLIIDSRYTWEAAHGQASERPWQAWTGSHRRAAAIQAGIEAVPVIIADGGDLVRHGVQLADFALAIEDVDRLHLLEHGGPRNAKAVALMRAEHVLNLLEAKRLRQIPGARPRSRG